MKGFTDWNGILVSDSTRKKFSGFEAHYTHLRAREGRMEDSEEIRKLPNVAADHPRALEWDIRRDTINRFLAYLRKKGGRLNILDVGCGNGFFSHLLSKEGHQVTGSDVSISELETAARCFGVKNPKWCYADILSDKLPFPPFDLVVFQASLQYFPDPRAALQQALRLLKSDGELHVLESPVYTSAEQVNRARLNSLSHFRDMDSSGMINYFHFHKMDVFKDFRYTVLKSPRGILDRLLRRTSSPFHWIRITRKDNPQFF